MLKTLIHVVKIRAERRLNVSSFIVREIGSNLPGDQVIATRVVALRPEEN
jgi:hypothetical protein